MWNRLARAIIGLVFWVLIVAYGITDLKSTYDKESLMAGVFIAVVADIALALLEKSAKWLWEAWIEWRGHENVTKSS